MRCLGKFSSRIFLLSTMELMPKLSIKDLDLAGKTVLIRVDFNVPLSANGKEITSDKRIRASLPTIQYALEHSAAVVLAKLPEAPPRVNTLPIS